MLPGLELGLARLAAVVIVLGADCRVDPGATRQRSTAGKDRLGVRRDDNGPDVFADLAAIGEVGALARGREAAALVLDGHVVVAGATDHRQRAAIGRTHAEYSAATEIVDSLDAGEMRNVVLQGLREH